MCAVLGIWAALASVVFVVGAVFLVIQEEKEDGCRENYPIDR
jgi:hypothetical protein